MNCYDTLAQQEAAVSEFYQIHAAQLLAETDLNLELVSKKLREDFYQLIHILYNNHPDYPLPISQRLQLAHTTPAILAWWDKPQYGAAIHTLIDTCEELDLDLTAHPSDPTELAHCIQLLKTFPKYYSKLSNITALSSQWNQLIQDWDLLTTSLENAETEAVFLYLQKQQ